MKVELQRKIIDQVRNEFVYRTQKNPHYSLRSFAQSLGIHSGSLSSILNQKRALTEKTARKLCQKLGLKFDALEGSRDSSAKPFYVYGLREQQGRPITWVEDAILECVQIEGFDGTEAWIARKLGLKLMVIKSLVRQLVREKKLKKISDRIIAEVDHHDLQINDLTTEELQKLQEQALERSRHALWHVPVERRYHSTMTMAVALKDLAKAKKLLREFRQRFCQTLQESAKPDEVYQLNISLYPVSNFKQSKKNGRKSK